MRILLLLLLPFFMAADLPIKYPEKTYSMNESDFYKWAVGRNKRARIKWERKFNKGYQYNYSSKEVEVRDASGFSTGKTTATPLSISRGPSKFSSTIKVNKRTVPYSYKNPNFRHPGPLTLINPYVKPKKAN